MHDCSPLPDDPKSATTIDGTSPWKSRYGAAHRLHRIKHFPAGISPPKKVRLYFRRGYFIVQWWDVGAKRTLSVRVTGDLIDAVTEARKIEARLLNFKSAGRALRKLGHEELVQQFVADLHRRADAGELAAATVTRYGTALGHYQSFCAQPEIRKEYPTAVGVNREFRLAFAAQLSSGTRRRGGRRECGIGPVFGALRAMFNWAADPNRGNVLPEGFRNPFDRADRPIRRVAHDLFGEPDVTVSMAVDFIRACDAVQLPLFATLTLCGLRAAEPVYLFREHVEEPWLRVNCLPELDYLTKGQRDKRFPLAEPLGSLLRSGEGQGLLFTRRSAVGKSRTTPLYGASLMQLSDEYHRRCRAAEAHAAVNRQRIREELIRDAGGLNYDQIEHEFHIVAQRLRWPSAATLKDFRHLFSTCLENAGVPEFYRRYFMGQSPGKAPIVTYTHLNELQKQYGNAVRGGLAPLAAAAADRAAQLAFKQSEPESE